MADCKEKTDSESQEISEASRKNSQPNHQELNASGHIPTPPSLSDRFEFIRKIGEGAQAKVYLANRLSDNQKVAIKQLDIDSVSNWKEYELFHREAAILSSLNIQGVAHFYEAIECLEDKPPCSYLVQEYIEGESLAAMLKAGHRFSTAEVYDIIIQMLTILGQLQSQPVPVIHRDIKPSNLMLTPTDGGYRVTLIDFGAVANPQVQSGGSTVAGTYGYMPPEQLMGKPSPASDIYSLAAVAVELFSGKSPATLPTRDFRLIFEPEMQSQKPELVNTLRKMLEPDVKNRLCDLTKLQLLFTDYKEGKFKHAGEPSQADQHFNQKLAKVCDIGVPGNIELWQKLQDDPVRTVPEIYHHLGKTHTSPPRLRSVSMPPAGFFLVLGWLWLLVAALISTYIYPIPLLIIFAGIFVMIVLSLISLVNQLTSNNRKDKQNDNPGTTDSSTDPETKAISADDSMALHDLISAGRKTIATIVGIEYLPACEQNCEMRNGIFAIHSEPKFRIQYKFNPPDDMRNEDLIHSCIVHTEPENFYKIGDPLPILYRMKGKYFSEEIYSCPFPFSAANSSVDEIMYMSSAGAEFNNYCQSIKDINIYGKDEEDLNRLIQIAKDSPLLFGDLILRSHFQSVDCRLFVIGLCQFFLNSDLLSDIHPKCISFLISEIDRARTRNAATSLIISYLNRMKSGYGNPDVIKVLMKGLRHNMLKEIVTNIYDCMYDLLVYPEIRAIIAENIGNRYLGRLSDRIYEDDTCSDMHASVIYSVFKFYPFPGTRLDTFEDVTGGLLNMFKKRPIRSRIWNQVLQSCQDFLAEFYWLKDPLASNAFLDIYRELSNRDPQTLNDDDRQLMTHFENLTAPCYYSSLKLILMDDRYKKLHPMAIRGLIWTLAHVANTTEEVYKSHLLESLYYSDEGLILCNYVKSIQNKDTVEPEILEAIDIFGNYKKDGDLKKLFEIFQLDENPGEGLIFINCVKQLKGTDLEETEIIQAIDIFGNYKKDGDLNKLIEKLDAKYKRLSDKLDAKYEKSLINIQKQLQQICKRPPAPSRRKPIAGIVM